MMLRSHLHWSQSIERYQGLPIVYSRANFIFDQGWSRETLEELPVPGYWRGTTLASVRYVPTLIEERCPLRLMSPGEAADMFERRCSGSDLLTAGQYTAGGF